ncbi:MAG TPA: tRNA (N6-isopentenyl adenosine(37)-C2)-methylthiotransferase MiaB [Bdellovibrionota bacterium]|nr:tRNA (N6-isopentenyl adenosine(37)-C2)-methylthiotransferase MiaB [Bdellovibrionota bacterium]
MIRRMPIAASKIYIETYGCQMNDYESDRTFRLFHDQFGYEWTTNPYDADLVLFNTCSIREKADQKALSSIGTLRAAKLQNPGMVIAVGGCMAQSQGDDLQRRFPFVDIVFGTHQWANLPEMVEKARIGRERLMEVEFYGWKNYSFLPYRSSTRVHPVSELVTVQNGCDRFCTFCLVPFTRGREVSRPPEDIVDEVRALVDQGVREVTLLGQNVNAYGRDRSGVISFAELLRRVTDVPALERVRFVTSHPAELSAELIDAMAENPKVCEHLHLPVQSGSDTVLSRMNRGYTIDEYRRKSSTLLKKIPRLELTTDIIVGFPSETEADFQQTLDLVSEFQFADSFSFCFSPRPHTKAANWTSEFVSAEVGADRLSRLQSLQNEIRERKMKEYVGDVVEVLAEGEAKSGEGFLSGRTRTNRSVNFPGRNEWIGRLQMARITEALSHSFRGESVNAGVEHVH